MRWSSLLVPWVLCSLFAGAIGCLAGARQGTEARTAAVSPVEPELERLRAEGIAAAQQADFPAAEKAFRSGLEKARELGDRRWIARFLDNVGIACKEQGKLEEAIRHHTEAFHLRQALGDPRDLGRTLTNLGNDYFRLGQFHKALDCHTRALALYDALGQPAPAGPNDSRSVAGILNNLGNVYNALGQWDPARHSLTRALDLYRALGNPQEIAYAHGNLGNVYQSMEQFDRARELYAGALRLQETFNNPQDRAITLNNLGNVLANTGQWEPARDHYTRALALRETLGNPLEIAATLVNLGVACRSLGQLDAAREHLDRALALQQPLGNEQDLAVSFGNLALVSEQQGQLDEAEAAFARAVRHSEAVGAQIGDPARIGAFQEANLRSLYARYAGLLVRRGRAAEGLAVVERGRAQGLARQTALTPVDLSSFLSKKESDQFQALTTSLTAEGRRVYAAAGRPAPSDTAARSAWQKEQKSVYQQYEAAARRLSLFRDGLFARNPTFRRLQGHQPPTPEQLAALARRHPDTLFLEWAVMDETRTLLFSLSSRDGLRSFSLPTGRADLRRRIAAWRLRLTGASPEEPAHAAKLFQTVLGPLESAGLLAAKRAARLVLVSDGPLLELPWAALRDKNGKRLIDRYSLATSLSLGVLTWPANPRKPAGTLLCAVDPAPQKGEPVRVALRSGLGPLKHARSEAEAVRKLFPGAVGLAGAQVRESALKQRMGRFALLHFATHGVLDTGEGLRSWLMLAPEPVTSAEDGRLEAREVLGVPLSAQLAVLSACDTGRGQVSGGEGLLGLAWAFQGAGCPSVVASQWKVDDRATGRLMTAFYRGLKAGRSKDDALRAAMQQVRKEPTTARPFYWAGFQVIGSAAPVSLR